MTLNDIVAIVGLVLLAVGLWLVSIPLALQVVGSILFLSGVILSIRRARSVPSVESEPKGQ